MDRRDTPLTEKHMSPAKVAQFMLTRGRNVGVKYSTEGDVWNAKDSDHVIGLLQLIVRELRKQPATTAGDKLAEHARWYSNLYSDDTKLIALWRKQFARIDALVGGDKAVTGRFKEPCIQWLSERYVRTRTNSVRSWEEDYFQARESILREVNLMRSVKCVDDLLMIPGIGKKTVQKLKQVAA